MKNPKYVDYHDKEWGVLNLDEQYLYEMLILESFQAGLSWECILNKRDNFKAAFDHFNIDKVCSYDEGKISQLLADGGIIRNRRKIEAAINNSRIFKTISLEHGSFGAYLENFTGGIIIYETCKCKNELSDRISRDLIKRGMKFCGSTIIYSYLQAIGIIYSHDEECFLHKGK